MPLLLFVDLWGEVYSAADCSLVNIVSYTLFSFELAILNVLHSFHDFSKQKLCIKSRILLHVKKGNSSIARHEVLKISQKMVWYWSGLRIPRGLGNKYYPAVIYT